MTRTKKFLYNSIFTGLLQVVLLVINFVLPKVIINNYGSEINGLTSSITQFITYFNLVEAGLAAAAVYALYKPLADKNQKAINVVVSTAKSFYYKSGLIFTALVLVLALVYPLFVTIDSINPPEMICLIIVLGASGFLDFFTLAKYRVLLTADQRVYVISIASIIYNIVNTIIIVLLANKGLSIVLVRFIAVFAVIIRSIILMIYVRKKYKNIAFNEQEDKKLLSKRWDALYLQILGSIQSGAPVVLLTIFSSLVQVSVYSIYNMILLGVNSILSIFINGLSSSFGDIIIRKEYDKLKKVSEEFEYLYYNIITIVYGVAFVLIIPFIKLYTAGIKDANYIYPLVGFLFVLNGLLFNVKTPQGMLVISAGMYKETKVQSTIQGLIIVVVGLILTPSLGIVGVIIASILANLYRDIDLLFFIPKNLTHRTVMSSFKRITKIFVFILVIFGIDKLFNYTIISYKTWIIYAIILVVVSIVLIFAFDLIFEKKQIGNLNKRIKGLIGGK